MSLALAPLGMLYGAVTRARAGLYRAGFLKTESVGAPVVSVGNLTAGGTGKTPLVEWVAPFRSPPRCSGSNGMHGAGASLRWRRQQGRSGG